MDAVRRRDPNVNGYRRISGPETFASNVDVLPAPPPFGRALNIALAMKGGVSLAVWIGGGVAELDVLRRLAIVGDPADPTVYFADNTTEAASDEVLTRARIYASLLISRRYDAVTFDVLAGASAGGLNGVLYAVAQRAGASVDSVLSVWQGSGDIWKLLRDDGFGPVPSVLRGDGYFWGQVQAALEVLFGEASGRNTAHAAGDVVLDLSATISDPDYCARLSTRAGRGHFHFVGSNTPEVNRAGRGIPSSNATPDDRADLARLAYAARTTSSFPGAFEPALIWSHDFGPQAENPAPPAFAGPEVDMSMAFGAHRPGMHPFRVIDGGVLDNIPIDRAMHAIRAMPASRFGTRILVYLDPSPDLDRVEPESAVIAPPSIQNRLLARTDALSQFVRIVRLSLKMRGISESGSAEVASLGEWQRELFDDEGRLDALSRTPAAASDRAAKREGYILSRGSRDSSLLIDLLQDPERWQLDSSLLARQQMFEAPSSITDALPTAFFERYRAEAALFAQRAEAMDAATAILTGSQALLDATQACMGWLRDLEESAHTTRNLSSLATPLAASNGPGVLPIENLRELLNSVSILSRSHRDVGYARVVATVAEHPDSDLPGLWLALEAQAASDAALQWPKLNFALHSLRAYTAQAGGLAQTTSPWARFSAVDGFDATDLAPFVAVSGIPDPSSGVQFTTITASDQSPLERGDSFAALLVDPVADVVQHWLRMTPARFAAEAGVEPLTTHLTSESKLAGAGLANFAAFFSRSWRTNDWWWGRVDAAGGIARVVQSLPRETEPVLPDQLAAAIVAEHDDRLTLQRSALAESTSGPDAVNLRSANHALADLQPSYLVGIVSRLVRIVKRALAGGTGRVGRAALHMFWPIVMVFVPLVVVPARALLFVAVVVLGAAVGLGAGLGAGAGGGPGAGAGAGLGSGAGAGTPHSDPTALPGWVWLGLSALAVVAVALSGAAATRRRRQVVALPRIAQVAAPVRALLLERLDASAARFRMLRAVTLVAALASFVVRTDGLAAASLVCGAVAVWAASAAGAAVVTLAPARAWVVSRRVWCGAAAGVLAAAVAVLWVGGGGGAAGVVGGGGGGGAGGDPVGIGVVAVLFGVLALLLGGGWIDGGLGGRPTARGILRLILVSLAVALVALVVLVGAHLWGGQSFNAWQHVGTAALLWVLCSHTFWWLSSMPSTVAQVPDDRPAGAASGGS